MTRGLQSKIMDVSDLFTVCSQWGTIDEADGTEFEIGSTRVRAGDAQPKNDGVASEIGDGEGNEQAVCVQQPRQLTAPTSLLPYSNLLTL